MLRKRKRPRRRKDFLTVATEFDSRYPGGEAIIGDLDDRLQRCNVRQPVRQQLLRTAMLRTMKHDSSVVPNVWVRQELAAGLQRRGISCRVASWLPGIPAGRRR